MKLPISNLRALLLPFMAVLLCALLAGCGNKSDLVLPSAQPAVPATQPPPPQPPPPESPPPADGRPASGPHAAAVAMRPIPGA